MAEPGIAQPHYLWDVFISYRRTETLKTWVRDTFLQEFADRLTEELEVDHADVFWDEDGLVTGDEWSTEVATALARSRCILPLWTGSYFGSAWCMAEWNSFRLRAHARGLAKGLVAPLRWHDGDGYPPEAKALRPANFETYSYNQLKGSGIFVPYQQAVATLAKEVAAVINRAPPFEAFPIVTADEVRAASQARPADRTEWYIVPAKPPDRISRPILRPAA